MVQISIFTKKKSAVPQWAQYFSESEYTAFMSAIDSFFQNTLHLSYKVLDGMLTPEENNLGLVHLGLDNLGRICKQYNVGEYPDIVASHFNNMIEAEKFNKEFDKNVKEYCRVEQYIAVRLYNADYMSFINKDNYICREFAGELLAVLVFDLPHTISNIKPEQMKFWGKTEDELFEIGLENVRKKYDIKAEAVEFGPEGDFIFAYEAAHFFATNILFDVDKHIGLVGKGGSLAAAPTRHIAFVYPINDLKRAVNMINNLCIAVPGIYSNTPGALTKEIYWYNDGRFMPLPYKFEKKKISLYPPEEFVGVLNSLPSGE